MVIIVDTREKKNDFILEYFNKNGIEYSIEKLNVGDYAVKGFPTFAIDRKANLQELISNVVHDHKRFSKEIQRAIDNNVELVFLIEEEDVQTLDDLKQWKNYRKKWSPKATTGAQLLKSINTIIDTRYELFNDAPRFLFVDREHYAQTLVKMLEDHIRKENDT